MNHKLVQNLVNDQDVTFTIKITPAEEDGGFVAECLDIPGCFSQGETVDEAKANIADAIEACVSVILEDAIPTLRSASHADVENVETVRFSHRLTAVA